MKTTWGSKPAENMYQIATVLAGFDPKELMMEIHRLVMPRDSEIVNVATVLHAMQILYERGETGKQRRAMR